MPARSLIGTASTRPLTPRVVRRREELRPYQLRAAEWMQVKRSNATGTANWIDLGLGKTASTLTAFLELRNNLLACTALVVGPKKVAKNTWPEEIETWEHTRGGHLTYSVVVGTEAQRLAALRKKADLYLINVECLDWLERVLTHYGLLKVHGNHKRTPFDVVIIDEADLFKNRDSKRFKVMRRIARMAHYVIELTGTPATEGYHHLWAQFYLLDGGVRLFSSVGEYLSTYFKNIGTTEQAKYVPKSTAAKARIHERIKDITFTLRAEDYLQLPKHNVLKRWAEMDEREWDLYRRMQRDALVRLADGNVIRAQSASAVNQKLAQLSNGQVYDDERRVHVIHRRKLEELQSIYQEAQGHPLLVAYEFQHDRDLIAREFGAVLFDDDKETENRWNEGRIPMMLIHPKSGGHGVNIQFGGHNLVRYGLAHSLGLYLQLLKRLVRPGQPSPYVNEWFIFTRGTLDESILTECIERKNYSHEGLLNAMKRYVATQYMVDARLPQF
jgi:SNF2 family DNA or RNA helicase